MLQLFKCRHVVIRSIFSFSVFLSIILAGPVEGKNRTADWPNWRGPNYNGISTEIIEVPREEDFKKLWHQSVGTGFSSFSVGNGCAYTMGNTGKKGKKTEQKDIIYCLDINTGKITWEYPFLSPLEPKLYEGGPNSTPSLHGSFVYTFSKHGEVFCFNAKNGEIIWRKNLHKELKFDKPSWGFSSSPLIMDKMLILNAGTAGIALDKNTGTVLWSNGTKAPGYATPVPLNIAGKKSLLLFGSAYLYAVNASNGKQLWDYQWKTSYKINAADPIIEGDEIFISSGYGKGCTLLKMSPDGCTEIWRNKKMRNQINSSVLWKDHIYGFDGQVGGGGKLICLEFKTGKVKWSRKGMGTGSLIMANGMMIILSEKGKLIIAQARPDKFEPLLEKQILQGKCWTAPVLAGGKVFARNADGDVVCYQLAKN